MAKTTTAYHSVEMSSDLELCEQLAGEILSCGRMQEACEAARDFLKECSVRRSERLIRGGGDDDESGT
jgi:hypothetical protein